MLKRNILAHRGIWNTNRMKNSREALFDAISLGFGIETDLRDLNGVLVISHDPATYGNSFPAEELFEYYVKVSSNVNLALNVKADGLQDLLSKCIKKTGIQTDHIFVFDMSIPDLNQYVATKIPRYTRVSDIEPDPLLIENCNGIWVDDFCGKLDNLMVIPKYLSSEIPVVLVSPELHGRGYEVTWEGIKIDFLHTNPLLSICTDFPEKAYQYFKG